MNFKRILAVVLAAVMCLCVLASCNQGDGEETRPQGSQGGNEPAGDFKSADYEGNEFTFLVIKHIDSFISFWSCHILMVIRIQ